MVSDKRDRHNITIVQVDIPPTLLIFKMVYIMIYFNQLRHFVYCMLTKENDTYSNYLLVLETTGHINIFFFLAAKVGYHCKKLGLQLYA